MKTEEIISNNYLLTALLGVITVAGLGAFWDENLSVLVLSLLFAGVGVMVSYILNLRGDKKNSIYIFLLFFAIYMAYNLIVLVYLINFYGLSYIKGDEEWFYWTSNDVYIMLKNGHGFTDVANIDQYGDAYGAVYLYGRIAYLAHIYGENSIYVQKVGVSFIAALIPMAMYGISRLYLHEKTSIIVAIIYGSLSFVPFFASTLLRDIHIALMYVLAMYIILQRFSWLNLFILIVVTIFSYTLREQTGVFMVGFISIYLFAFIERFIENRNIKTFIYLILLLILGLTVYSIDALWEMFNQIATSSAQRSQESASSGSMGAKIAKLPIPFNAIALFGFGQIQPFPPGLIFKIGHKDFLELTFLIAGIAWFYGWVFLLYGILKAKVLQTLDLKLLLMFSFSLIYILLISIIEFSARRQMAVYPIIFLVMVMSYLKTPETVRTKIWVGVTMIYTSLVLILNYMKL